MQGLLLHAIVHSAGVQDRDGGIWLLATLFGQFPDNPAETWAGRGLKPRWLTAAIKSGKKVEDFLITGSAVSKANGRKKANGATVKAKRAQAEVCPICDFQTTPPHDGRTHRSQKKKAPFSAAELTDKGLAKV